MQHDRLLDPESESVTPKTSAPAAEILDLRVRIELLETQDESRRHRLRYARRKPEGSATSGFRL